jgi:hypothetical protein
VISGYITTFMSICWRLMFMPMSSRSPFIFIMSFIISIPSKYFSGCSGAASCRMPLPSHREVERTRSSLVATSS